MLIYFSPIFNVNKALMHINALMRPVILDAESLHEFRDTLADQVPNIERIIVQLKRTPGSKPLIAELFRALHNIKGDAAMCKVDMGVMITHPIETLVTRLRDGEIGFSDMLAEVIMLAMDRLGLATETLAESLPGGQQSLGHLKLVELVSGLEQLAETPLPGMDDAARQLIEAVTGFRPLNAAPVLRPRDVAGAAASDSAGGDLHFFRALAQQYEARAALFNGRSERQLHLALEANTVAGTPVNPGQLEAAVYMHDIGMLFIPEPLWLKAGKLTDEDRLALQGHPGFGAGLLQRMPGWQAAAEMVLQHHEMPDGKGYPRGLKNEQICPGAKILAVVDTFEAITHRHSKHGDERSLVRAIAEINACDKQFAPEWISAFNVVVRRMVEGK